MTTAFHNDAAVRQDALARLAAVADAGRLQAGHVAWSENKCSAVGALTGSDDLARWEAQLGLPAWFALVFEAAAAGARDAAGVVALCTEMLDAIAPGADLDREGSALILCLLDDAAALAGPAPLEPELAAVMETIVALHRRSLAGEQVEAAAWKAARRSATLLTDVLTAPLQKAVARCVESAAWDPLRSRTAALDTLREWRNAWRDKDLLDYGWAATQDAVVQAQLDSLHARYVVGVAEPAPNVFDLYEQHHAADAAALRAKMAFERANGWRLAGLAAPLVLGFLRARRAN
jgi:hypothetical protein